VTYVAKYIDYPDFRAVAGDKLKTIIPL